MRVRPAAAEDCPTLARGMKTVVEEGWLATNPSTAAEELEGRFRFAVGSDAHTLLALEDDSAAVGALGLDPTPASGVLSLGMWVLPSHRSRGGGRMLLEAGLAARPAGIHKLELEVYPDNGAAIRLYEALGFEREGLRRDHYRRDDGSLRSALIMSRLFTDLDSG